MAWFFLKDYQEMTRVLLRGGYRTKCEELLVKSMYLVPWLATTATFRPLLIAWYYGTMEYLMLS